MNTIRDELESGSRFKFGENWQAFLSTLNADRIRIAQESLRDMLGTDSLSGKKFIDVGSGSGLFSLAARMLGADVVSFDYDPASVACTQKLRSIYFAHDPHWKIQEGSILDQDFVDSLGSYDIVYSWGVLHHTGDMWAAIRSVTRLVGPNGILLIAIYNDQGPQSRRWHSIKKIYCSSSLGKAIVCGIFIPYFFLRTVMRSLIRWENMFTQSKKERGMSVVHDWLDWLGGFPFEVASVEDLFHYFQGQGFSLVKLRTTNGWGNNELVLTRQTGP